MRCQMMGGALCVWLMFAMCVQAQSSGPRRQSPFAKLSISEDAISPGSEQQSSKGAALKENLERQSRIRADTENLFKLVGELKDSIGKTSGNILSLDMLKKAKEIEKLAHSLKEQMRGLN